METIPSLFGNVRFLDAALEYKLPFEEEVGLSVSLEDMKQAVVDEHMRPQIKQQWREHEVSPHGFKINFLHLQRSYEENYLKYYYYFYFSRKPFLFKHELIK